MPINVNQGASLNANGQHVDGDQNDADGEGFLSATTGYTNADPTAYNSLANQFGAQGMYDNGQGQKAQGYQAPQASDPNAGMSQGQLSNAYSGLGQAAGSVGNSANGVNQGIAQNNQAFGLAMGQAQHGSALAQDQLQQGTDQGIAAQMALANSSTGGATQRAGALRQAQASGAQAQAQQSAQAGALQAQTQAQGLAQAGQLAGQTGSLYGTQGNLYSAQGSLSGAQGSLAQNQYALESGNANTQAGLDANVQANNNATALGYQNAANVANAGSLSALTGYNSAQTAADQVGAGEAAQNAKTGGSLLSGLIGAAGSFVGSDERMKSDVHNHDALVDDFLGRIDPKSFRYSNPNEPGAGHGQYLGAIAQDIEKTPGVGSTMVRDVGGRKMLDTGATLSGALAGLGRLNERLESLESKRGKR